MTSWRSGGKWLGHAAPCVIVWGAYLLAFWPALLGNDETAQWNEVLTRQFSNGTPAAHTLSMWLVTRVWLSPATVVVVQIVALSLVFGAVVRELDAWKVPAWAQWVVTILFSCSLVNGMMIVGISRDVAYSIANVALFGFLLRLVRSEGRSIRSGWETVRLWLVLMALSLYRHNGLLTAGATALVLPLLWGGDAARRLWTVTICWVCAYVAMVGLVYGEIGVHPMRPRVRMQYPIHQLGAIIAGGFALPPDDEAFLAQIEPLAAWRSHYNCYSVDPLIWTPDFHEDVLADHEPALLRLWSRLAGRHAGTVLSHQRCASSLVWRIKEPRDGRMFTVPLRRHDMQTSRWPWLAASLKAATVWSLDPKRVRWVWRPAGYLYLTLLCGVIVARRRRDWKTFVLVAPSVLNSVTWCLFGMAQHFRYQYPVYAISLIIPALTLARGHSDAAS